MPKANFLREIFRHFLPRERFNNGWSEVDNADRAWEELYRDRWQYDKVVRSTHGVNCTGSCSWRIYVKDGIVVWEHQAVDYPTNGPSMPEYEPRGCPRGASFSWYIYSPLRVKYPYVRGELMRLWREALARTGDPVRAWEYIVTNPELSARYKSARGKGGFVRASWDEVLELISAALIYTIMRYGPDRIFGFTPIPAMSMVSFSSGARFLELIGGVMLSFYDWYADLPIASPQVWGEQTDVHESADWYNSMYIIVWGTNVAMTRTPDAHFLAEARYKGTKVVVVTSDYTDVTKFADLWISPKPGTDAALAMAMVHVILREFYVDRQVDYFIDYVKRYTDLPFLVILEREGSEYVPRRLLRASDLGINTPNAEWKTVVLDSITKGPVIPNGSIGFRWSDEGKWNLKLEDSLTGNRIDPLLTLLGVHDDVVLVKTFVFDEKGPIPIVRGVPIRRVMVNGKELLVTTVYDLLLAHVGIDRGLPGDYPKSYDDNKPFTPAWQEGITGVDRRVVIRVAREFARNAELTRGKSMVIIGSGVNHWYNSDLIYRAIITMLMLLGTIGVNGGGWAHYVGQEKVRPLDSWSQIAFAQDWYRPPRLQNTTSWVYVHSDQFRYEDLNMKNVGVNPQYEHPVDYNVIAVRRGWLPFYPQFNVNPIRLYEDAVRSGATSDDDVVNYVRKSLREGRIKFSIEDPDNPENFPRILFMWRANFLASSGKGHEYILKHLLGADNSVMAKEGLIKPREVVWREQAPIGKLDLVVTLDFRMSTSALYSDIVLPAATWYEKNDLSTTDLHPFIHPFNQAVPPPWEAKSDWDIFVNLARVFSGMACKYLGRVRDVVVTPQLHDTPGELSGGNSEPNITIIERDYCDVYHRMITLGPLISKSMGVKGIAWSAEREYEGVGKLNGFDEHGHPLIASDKQVAEAILHLSSVTNGEVSYKAYKSLEERTGLRLTHIAEDQREVIIHFDDLAYQPRRVLRSPIWSGKESEGRPYTPFALNVEDLVPWRTLTGRQHVYLDHEWIMEFGEQLPTYKPPVVQSPFNPGEGAPINGKVLVVRYLTPHGKWQIHSTYMDNQIMLTLFRGGPVIWLNHEDAREVGIKDNDWVEVINRNGVVVARAVVTVRIPRGVAIMYHAQERTVNVGRSSITGRPGGVHNSVTRVRVKPTHMIGGYAQLSWSVNYYGPVGTQRDEVVLIRRLGVRA
ncbi:nitrate reductase subunit alpha [Vulcanisaeta thermophila]|uniref:nitrate reductase subunit alpha n=1 Tax=Vulcanisaeta thermophila TaxID=867917 RepID=UPI000853538F|nr:nitrate reductase subunit alpha [Vulcanisaeta thermophila]